MKTLFNLILDVGIVPDIFRCSRTTPIPKFKGVLKVAYADNYRGISISSAISKVFENCILPYLSEIKLCQRQFGFKKGASCSDAIHTVQKVINYFVNRKSTVNIGVIDLKRAFDKINIFNLLNVHMQCFFCKKIDAGT